MNWINDDVTTAFTKQADLALQCFNFGMEATQRMFQVQLQGTRELLELQGRHAGPGEGAAAGDDGPMQWLALSSRAMAGGTEAIQICFKTAAAMQVEVASLAEEIFPEFNHALQGATDRATRVMMHAVTISRPEERRKRAA